MVSECWGVYVTSEQQTGSAFRMVCNAGLWVFTHFPCLRGQDGSFWANCDCTQRIITDPVWGLLLFCFAAFLEFRLESEVWLNLLFVMSPLSMTILSAMQTFGLPVFSACLLTPAKVWNKKKHSGSPPYPTKAPGSWVQTEAICIDASASWMSPRYPAISRRGVEVRNLTRHYRFYLSVYRVPSTMVPPRPGIWKQWLVGYFSGT